jgi:hypothetical protein
MSHQVVEAVSQRLHVTACAPHQHQQQQQQQEQQQQKEQRWGVQTMHGSPLWLRLLLL